ncbi:MAG: OmpH family outer membrane protein [Alphaproteobacteria bacterium]|nr:MAG: OmpH family outer membrane protein [Alphaproteobacteria bacterium]
MFSLTFWHRHGAAALMILTFGVLLSAPLSAQEWKAPKIAIIDVQKIIRESEAVRSLAKEVDARRAKVQAALREKENGLRAADQELARQRSILSAEAFAQKRKELERQVGLLQREIKDQRRSLDQEFARGIQQVQRELALIAKDMAEKRGLDMILSKATIVIVKPEFDLTDEALKLLNKRLPKVATAKPTN